MRRINALIAAAAMTAGLGVAAPSVASAATAQPHTAASPARSAAASSITWGTCTETDLDQPGVHLRGPCGAAELQPPVGPEDRDRGVQDRAHLERQNYQGIILTNPGGPGGSGLDLNRSWSRQLEAGGLHGARRPTTTGSASTRAASAPAHRRSPATRTTSPDRAELRPDDRVAAQLLAEPVAWLRNCLRDRRAPRRPRCCDNDDHGRLRQGHGQHPAGAGPDADHLLRLLLRHLPRPGLRHAVPVPCAPADHGQQRRPARTSGTRPTSTRTSRSTATSTSGSAGWPSTTASTTSARPSGGAQALHTPRAHAGQAPGRRRVGPDEWTDIFLEAGYYQQTWLHSAARSPTG